MVNQWLQDPLAVAVISGIGTGSVTLARRLALPTQVVRRAPFWRRLQHSLAGFVWAAGAGGGISLVMADTMQPTRLIGLTILGAVCFDLTSSEGIAWIARTYLRITKDAPKEPPDESHGT